ncbi:MAG: GWxTD domain-containing protein [Candidatus Hydrothermales bacterium]
MIFYLNFLSFFVISFLVDTINFNVCKKIFEKGDSILVDVKVLPHLLVFKKSEEEFLGWTEFNISCVAEDKREYFFRFNQKVSFEKYEDTRDEKNRIKFQKWIALEGTIKKINIEVLDLNSQRRWTYSKEFVVKDFISVGDIIFYKIKENEIIYDVPPLSDSLYNFILTFKSKKKGRLEISFYKKNELFKKLAFEVKDGLNKLIDTLNLSNLKIPLTYNLEFYINKKKIELTGEISLKKIDLFSIFDWRDLIEALRILFDFKDVEELFKAKEEEKEDKWKAFWKTRDPDPQTPHNELEITFIERFEYVMKNFSGPIKGYKTDRGRIYIKYGSPDYIEDHPFEFGTYPYQIWYYTKLGIKFIFVDKTGFGDYQLVTDLRELYPQY